MTSRPALLLVAALAFATTATGCSSDASDGRTDEPSTTTIAATTTSASDGSSDDPTAAAVKDALSPCAPATNVTDPPKGATPFDCTNLDDDHSTYLYTFTDEDLAAAYAEEATSADYYAVVAGKTWVLLGLDQRVLDLGTDAGGELVAPIPD